ncbi:hypothetical protein PYX06_23295 [Citrobacter amalonaticus]|nr:hypothetical protein [Citrobacter amalonaticus]
MWRTIRGASQLVLEDSHGALWWVENPESGLHFEQITGIDDLLVTAGESHEGGAIWPWVLGGAVAAGGIAAIASSGGGGSSHHDNDNSNPGEGSGNVSTPGGWGAEITEVEITVAAITTQALRAGKIPHHRQPL